MDVNRVLAISGNEGSVVAGLADYQDEALSPVKSSDLMNAAEHPEKNFFYPFFKKRLPELVDKGCLAQSRALHSRMRTRKRLGAGKDCKENPIRAERLIGFSLNYLSQALCTFAMIGFIRKEFPGIKIVLGGGLITSWMKRPGWKNPFGSLVDHLVAGPGEGPLLSLLGVSDVKHNHYLPVYDSLPLEDYLSPGFILPYSGSSGCYWNKCSFCPEPAEGNPYVAVSIKNAMADLNALTQRTKTVMIHLLDSSISPALMRSLAEKPVGVPWYGFARIHHDLTDLDYCMALKKSECRMLKLGLESGDQGVLDGLQKGINLKTVSKVLKNLHQAGIATYIYLLFGTPVETIHEARKTLEFIVGHREAVSFLNLAIFNMPACGIESAEYETEQFYEGDLSLYTGFKHPRGWDRKLVRHFLETEFKRHAAVSGIIKKDPPVFTSNHAAFFGKAGS